MDCQGPLDFRAVDEFVRRVDYPFARVAFERGPGRLEEVEVAFVAFGAFVYDLVEGGSVSSFGSHLFIIFIFFSSFVRKKGIYVRLSRKDLPWQ